jgi:hypothetical protein
LSFHPQYEIKKEKSSNDIDSASGIFFMPPFIPVISSKAKGSTPEIVRETGNELQKAGYLPCIINYRKGVL